jgi:hypothetical protein
LGAIDKRTRPDDVGPDAQTAGNLRSPAIDLSEISPHVTDARHAIHDQQRESVFRGIGQVPVHVPKSRDQEFSAAIN